MAHIQYHEYFVCKKCSALEKKLCLLVRREIYAKSHQLGSEGQCQSEWWMGLGGRMAEQYIEAGGAGKITLPELDGGGEKLV